MGFQDFGDFGHPRHPAIRTTGLLTFALAGLSPAEHTSVCWTQQPDVPISGCMGLFLSRGARSTTFSFFLRFLGPFFCSTRAAAFFRPDRKMPKPTRAAA